jgi:predicted RNase H-related nuclease YkuK (DUF458 family)
MFKTDHQVLQFKSPSFDRAFTIADIGLALHSYIADDPGCQYSVIVGTDSHRYQKYVTFVTAIVFHRHGKGGRYFWREEQIDRIATLRHQIYQETVYSINVAHELMEQLKQWPMFDVNLEIHVDIGQYGDTRDLIREVIGMVKGNGFRAKMKPESFAASTIADRHT